jgi:hypothetical protein
MSTKLLLLIKLVLAVEMIVTYGISAIISPFLNLAGLYIQRIYMTTINLV